MLTSTAGRSTACFMSGTSAVPPAMTRASSPLLWSVATASSTVLLSTYSKGRRIIGAPHAPAARAVVDAPPSPTSAPSHQARPPLSFARSAR